MALSFETLQISIDKLAHQVMGQNARQKDLRKVRLFLGVMAIIFANVWLGAVIGHGLAAILGVGVYFIVAIGGGDALKDGEE